MNRATSASSPYPYSHLRSGPSTNYENFADPPQPHPQPQLPQQPQPSPLPQSPQQLLSCETQQQQQQQRSYRNTPKQPTSTTTVTAAGGHDNIDAAAVADAAAATDLAPQQPLPPLHNRYVHPVLNHARRGPATDTVSAPGILSRSTAASTEAGWPRDWYGDLDDPVVHFDFHELASGVVEAAIAAGAAAVDGGRGGGGGISRKRPLSSAATCSEVEMVDLAEDVGLITTQQHPHQYQQQHQQRLRQHQEPPRLQQEQQSDVPAVLEAAAVAAAAWQLEGVSVQLDAQDAEKVAALLPPPPPSLPPGEPHSHLSSHTALAALGSEAQPNTGDKCREGGGARGSQSLYGAPGPHWSVRMHTCGSSAAAQALPLSTTLDGRGDSATAASVVTTTVGGTKLPESGWQVAAVATEDSTSQSTLVGASGAVTAPPPPPRLSGFHSRNFNFTAEPHRLQGGSPQSQPLQPTQRSQPSASFLPFAVTWDGVSNGANSTLSASILPGVAVRPIQTQHQPMPYAVAPAPATGIAMAAQEELLPPNTASQHAAQPGLGRCVSDLAVYSDLLRGSDPSVGPWSLLAAPQQLLQYSPAQWLQPPQWDPSATYSGSSGSGVGDMPSSSSGGGPGGGGGGRRGNISSGPRIILPRYDIRTLSYCTASTASYTHVPCPPVRLPAFCVSTPIGVLGLESCVCTGSNVQLRF